MSWKQIIPGGKQRSTLGVAMAYRHGHGTQEQRHMFIYLGPDVMEQLCWEVGRRVGVYFGEGEHSSLVRIAPAAKGTIKVRNVGGSHSKLGVVFQPPFTLNESYFSEPVNYEVKAGGIEATLPLWARADQPVKPSYRDVSGALMGDPKPGKSRAA